MTYKFTQLAPKIQDQVVENWLNNHSASYLRNVWHLFYMKELERFHV